METVSEFTYLGERVSTGVCETAVTVRTRCGLVGLGIVMSCFMVGFL